MLGHLCGLSQAPLGSEGRDRGSSDSLSTRTPSRWLESQRGLGYAEQLLRIVRRARASQYFGGILDFPSTGLVLRAS